MNKVLFDPKTLDGASLAYLGDAVEEIYVRERLIREGVSSTGELTARSHDYVTAVAQSAAFRRIEGMLTQEETDIFKRGRNSGHLTVPHKTPMSDYRVASGLEALLGCLYLQGREDRIRELLDTAYADGAVDKEEI